MVDLRNWEYSGVCLCGICIGHNNLPDGTYIHTSPVIKFELCKEGLFSPDCMNGKSLMFSWFEEDEEY